MNGLPIFTTKVPQRLIIERIEEKIIGFSEKRKESKYPKIVIIGWSK